MKVFIKKKSRAEKIAAYMHLSKKDLAILLVDTTDCLDSITKQFNMKATIKE